MPSLRHNPTVDTIAGKGAGKSTVTVARTAEDGYLDAARDVILSVGWSRATLTGIAKRAGVSRMTLYRRWPDTRSLLADLLTRELTDLLADALAGGTDGTRAGLVDAICRTVRAMRADPLLARIVELDPELLLPYLLERRGRSQDLVAEALAGQLAEAQRSGEVRAGSPTVLARSILLAAHGFTLSAGTMGRPADYDRELRLMLDGYLR
jgi:AcrR family transcriptional regulator